MNMHIPQTRLSEVELKKISSVVRLIVSSQNSAPFVGIRQDALVAAYMMTRDGIMINRKNMMNLLMFHDGFQGNLPEPEYPKGKEYSEDFWSGRQLVSMILPNINITGQNSVIMGITPNEKDTKVVIRDGKIITGQLANTVIGGKPGSLHHLIYLDYSPEESKNFLDRMNRIANNWLLTQGFTVSARDVRALPEAKEPIQDVLKNTFAKIKEKVDLVSKGLLEAKLGNTPAEQYEEDVYGITGIDDQILKIVTPLLDKPYQNFKDFPSSNKEQKESYHGNAVVNMITSGSNATPDKLKQIVGVVGQQALAGKRIPMNYKNRCLPHFHKYDIGPQARGFIVNSFIRGMEPVEFFFSQTSGREGVIDTSIKTASSGYIQRKLMKGMEDLRIHYDNTIRNTNGQIVQFLYGADGLDPRYIEKQKLFLYSMSNEAVEKKYFMSDAELKEIGVKKGYDFKKEVQEMIELRDSLRNVYLKIKNTEDVDLPVNIRRLIENTKSLFKCGKNTKTDLTPEMVRSKVNKLLQEIPEAYRNKDDITYIELSATIFFQALVKMFLGVKPVIYEHRLTSEAFDYILDNIKRKFTFAVAPPGYAAGPVAAQSIGEPITQGTLNTFHFSGTASASKTTQGIPRTSELLSLSKKLKLEITTLALTDEIKYNREKAYKIGANVQFCVLSEVVGSSDIFYDPDDKKSVVEEDQKFINDFLKYNLEEDIPEGLAGWVIRYTIDKEALIYQQVRMRDIKKRIQEYNKNIFLMYTDDNADKLVIRIRINPIKLLEKESDLYKAIRNFEGELLNNVVIKGVENISDVEVVAQKENVFDASGVMNTMSTWILKTNGLNLMKLFGQYGIDYQNSYSNDPHEVNAVLGIEAARTLLINELIVADVKTNYHHLSLLVDTMTSRGYLMSIDRHGINRSDIGPIARSSFEETTEQLVNASVWSEVDTLKGVSANIMLGRIPPVGTGAFDVLFDEKYSKKSKTMDEVLEDKFD